MKSFLHILFLSLLFNAVYAQEKHFVFIQSDNRQPFNVSLNGKLYSSTASGYVIIPKLTEGEYTANIGFAANAYPDQSFKYVIDKKDLGFNLKNFGDKGWGLFNLQTFAVTMPGNANTTDVATVAVEKPKDDYKPEISFERKKEPPVTKTETKTEDKQVATDAQTNSEQAKQTTVNTQSTTVATEAEKPVAASATTGTDKTTLEANDKSADAANANLSAANKSAIKKVAEEKGKMGVYLTYVDENSRDTVQLIIPTAGKKKASENEMVSGNEVIANKETKASKRSSKKDDPQFLNIEINGAKKDSATAKVSPAANNDNVQPISNSNCTNAATDQDYARLRKKMAQETTDEKMINEAKKVYKNKCFTTTQIRGLSTLFLSDEGRYKFFDASYNFVTDAQLYSSLEKEFIDPSFVTRFKAMLHK